MRSSEIKSFESHVKSLDALNKALKSVDRSKVHVGKLGHVKVTVECTVDNKTFEANFSRGELAKFALQLAKLDNASNKGLEGLTKFKKRLKKLNEVIDNTLSENKSKRVRVGRKVASVVRHFHNPDKKIKKAIDKTPVIQGSSSVRSEHQSEDSEPIKPTRKGSTSSSDYSTIQYGSDSASETKTERKKRKGQHLYSVPTPGKIEINRSSKSGGSSSQEE